MVTGEWMSLGLSPYTLMGLSLITFLAVFIFHELGHLIYARKAMDATARIVFDSQQMKLYTEIEDNRETFDPKHQILLRISGIIAGLIPIMILLGVSGWMGLLLIPYIFIGCKRDIEEIMNRNLEE